MAWSWGTVWGPLLVPHLRLQLLVASIMSEEAVTSDTLTVSPFKQSESAPRSKGRTASMKVVPVSHPVLAPAGQCPT